MEVTRHEMPGMSLKILLLQSHPGGGSSPFMMGRVPDSDLQDPLLLCACSW